MHNWHNDWHKKSCKKYANYANIMQKLCKHYAETMQKLCKLCRNYAEIMQKLCRNYAEIMQKLCRNYAYLTYHANNKHTLYYRHNYAIYVRKPGLVPGTNPGFNCVIDTTCTINIIMISTHIIAE